jgi:hypothetical protein
MDDLNDLISDTDFFLFFIYALIGYFLIRYVIFKNRDKRFYLMVKIFFGLKLISAIVMSLLTVYYWKIGDAISYFNESQNLIQLFKKDISNIKYLFIPVEYYSSQLSLDNDLIRTVNGAGQESSFLISKLCAIFYPFALGKYLLVNFLFCFMSIVGQLKFYTVLVKRYPHLKKVIAISILFMPTLLLYSSTIYKETLCYSCIGFIFYNFHQIMHKRNAVWNTFFLILNAFLILTVKFYVIVAFLISIFLLLFFQFVGIMFRHSLITKSFVIILLMCLSTLFIYNIDFFNPYVLSFVDTSNNFQQYYNNDFGETSSFEIGEIELSAVGLLKKMPIGFYSTYFRPHIWEVKKPIVLFSALESFFILAFTLWTLTKKGIYLFQLIKKDLFARLSLYYVIILGIIIGLNTFNFGTLIRYKVPVVPFAWLFVFILYYYTPTIKIEKKSDRGFP